MAIDKRLLEILCCPTSKAPLRLLSRRQLDALNAEIGQGNARTIEGRPLAGPLREALITSDGKLIYPVDDGIPVLLSQEAVATLSMAGFPEA